MDRMYCAQMTIIAGRKQKDALLAALQKAGAQLTSVMFGKGTVKASYLYDVLGLIPEDKKAVISCVLPCDRVDSVLDMLVNAFHFDQPNTGVAFTIPLDALSF